MKKTEPRQLNCQIIVMHINFIITLYDVSIKLKDHIPQFYNVKCAYKIKPQKFNGYILQFQNVFF